jgi:proton glutamate symport protein
MMLESVVYPYLLCSLIGGLGSLAPSRAWRLIRASWATYAFLWIIAFAGILALGSAIPASPPPIEIIGGAKAATVSIVDLLIPRNIITALVQNYVPAIVIFAVAFGFAIQPIADKTSFLSVIEVVRRGSLAIWGWIVYLAPIGVFALFASTAGSMAPDVAEKLSVYLGLFLVGTAILAFWVLPVALSALVPARARELLVELRPALVLAMVTTLSVVALPFIEKAATRLLARSDVEGEEASDVIRATASLAYVFVQLGNYFIGLFVLYYAFLSKVRLTPAQHVLLPLMTLLSGIGSPSTTIEAVNFLSSWLGLPTGAVSLYIESMAITRYGQVALSVMAFGFATIAISSVYFGVARWRPRRMVTALALGVAAFLVVVGGVRGASDSLFPAAQSRTVYHRTLDPALVRDVQVTMHATLPGSLLPVDGPPTLDGIRQRGVLRVGYGRDIVPFTYINASGALVGFDISYAYELARDLHVRLDLYPVDWTTVVDDLRRHLFDIVMAGAYLTDDRLQRLEATDPYFVSPLGFITRSGKVNGFLSYEAMKARTDLRLGVFRDPVLRPMLTYLFPNARLTTLDSYDELPTHPEIEAAVWSLEQARAWASRHSGFTAVEPADIGAPLVFGYLLPPQSVDVTRFMNLWLSLHAQNGFRDAQVAYWIKEVVPAGREPRWNVIDNLVLPALRRAPGASPTPR